MPEHTHADYGANVPGAGCDLCGERNERIAKLERQLRDWEEREAAVCPEDYGFDEVIGSLRAKLAERDEQVRKLRGGINTTLVIMSTSDPDKCEAAEEELAAALATSEEK